ncbi:hypothetical protein EDD11_003762 [Mortierella claussenii]|nr:hypothetical protein EDD11_003762 [Mortierella claussenii]
MTRTSAKATATAAAATAPASMSTPIALSSEAMDVSFNKNTLVSFDMDLGVDLSKATTNKDKDNSILHPTVSQHATVSLSFTASESALLEPVDVSMDVTDSTMQEASLQHTTTSSSSFPAPSSSATATVAATAPAVASIASSVPSAPLLNIAQHIRTNPPNHIPVLRKEKGQYEVSQTDVIPTAATTTRPPTATTAASAFGHGMLHGYTANAAFPMMTDRLSWLPSELLFHVFCQLDAVDLSRVAQANKVCARMATDNGVWRIKSMQHPLFLEQHLQGQWGHIPWREYYKFLHGNERRIKCNWADARPEAVHVLEGHTGMVTALEMSMWTLVTASIDSTLRIWDLRTLQCLQVLRSRHSLTCVSQSTAAGVVCARTSFGGLYIWDMRTGELILQDDAAMPQNASFMYMDENYIGYGQCDGGVTVFDWSSRTSLKIVGSHHAHEGDVIHISIKERDYVISASTNGETLVYSLKRSCLMERILLPHATQAIQFTPTIHDGKVMFSTRDAVYEYELMLDHLVSQPEKHEFPGGTSHSSRRTCLHGQQQRRLQRRSKESMIPLRSDAAMVTPERLTPANLPQPGFVSSASPSLPRPFSSMSSSSSASTQVRPSTLTSSSARVWKASNSLLSQIRQRVGGIGKAFDQERQQIIPTRFPRPASIYCLPRTYRNLDHGTTSARDSYGVFLLDNCTHLHEISVYTRATKQVKQIWGPAVESVLANAVRGRFYTTMECNMHCAVVSSGNKVYVISFLPTNV